MKEKLHLTNFQTKYASLFWKPKSIFLIILKMQQLIG